MQRAPCSLRLSRLRLNDFRVFERREFEFRPGLNLLVGPNNCGKSAVLEAAATMLGGAVSGIPGTDDVHISSTAPRRRMTQLGDQALVESKYPVRLEADGLFFDQEVTWARELRGPKGRTTTGELASVKRIASSLFEGTTVADQLPLPIVRLFGTGRLHGAVRVRSSGSKGREDRLAAYKASLHGKIHEHRFVRWFRKMDLASLRAGAESDTLRGAKIAILRFFPDFDDVSWDEQEADIVMANGGESMPLHLMSDGVRGLLSLVGDIVYRIALANPTQRGEAFTYATGVVLIDELDMHLHPNWQRQIPSAFADAFPNVQVIATTHSPFLIQAVGRSNRDGIIDLGDFDEVELSSSIPESSLEEIAEDIQKVPQVLRSPRAEHLWKLTKEYYSAVRLNSPDVEERRAAYEAALKGDIREPILQAFAEYVRGQP